MRILALEKEIPETPADVFAPHLRREAEVVWELYTEGIIREMFFREDRNEAVLVLECNNVQDAEQALARLPLVAEGLIAFEIIPLKAYPGLSRLFAET